MYAFFSTWGLFFFPLRSCSHVRLFLISSGVLSVRHGRTCLWFIDTQTCSLRKGRNALVSDRQDLLIKARAPIPIPADIPLGGGTAPMTAASLQESTISFGYGSAFGMLSEGEVPKASTPLPAMNHTTLPTTTALFFVIGRDDLSRPASPELVYRWNLSALLIAHAKLKTLISNRLDICCLKAVCSSSETVSVHHFNHYINPCLCWVVSGSLQYHLHFVFSEAEVRYLNLKARKLFPENLYIQSASAVGSGAASALTSLSAWLPTCSRWA